MIPSMTVIESSKSSANNLCKACGLCCTGHLFIWAKLSPSELDPAESLGMHVYRSDPNQRGFSQPCPLWMGECTIYTSRHYPHVCRAYKCKLLKEVMADLIPIENALHMLGQAKKQIAELEKILPRSQRQNFRERMVECLEDPILRRRMRLDFRQKAESLLAYYEDVFGVDDLIEKPGDL